MNNTQIPNPTVAPDTTIFDPATQKTYPLVDSTAAFSAICRNNASNANAIQTAIRLKGTRRIAMRSRSLSIQTTAATPATTTANDIHYSLGFWYRSGTMLFTNSTAIRKTILFPDTLGAVSNNFLYLTSTNRSEKGVEAHIAFYAQETARFDIYDWSQNGNDGTRVCDVPITDLAKYVTPTTSQGLPFNAITLVNETRLLTQTTWQNRVHLAVLVENQIDHYDTIYSYEYSIECNAQQNANRNGYWGPEVEFWQGSFPQQISAVGYQDVWLIQDGDSYSLSDGNTYLHDDQTAPNRLKIVYQNDARDFLVR